jgi:hypothetical protein
LLLKVALDQTTHTQGWKFVKDIADRVVKAAVQAALDEDDPIKGESLRLKAKALQAGLNDLFNAIEQSQKLGTEEEPDWFTQLGDWEEQVAQQQ